MGKILFIMAPNVPPTENAWIPKNMKVKTRTSIIAKMTSEIVKKAGDIPK